MGATGADLFGVVGAGEAACEDNVVAVFVLGGVPAEVSPETAVLSKGPRLVGMPPGGGVREAS
jgi:hypothetical protein